MLELVWVVLTRRQPYRHFSHERIAYKYLTWAWQMDEEARDGLTRQQFARYYLMRLGIGQDLTRIALDPKHPRRLASEAELLALRPELQHAESLTSCLPFVATTTPKNTKPGVALEG